MSAATQNEMERLRKERDEHEQARTALEEELGQVVLERDAALEREQGLAAHVDQLDKLVSDVLSHCPDWPDSPQSVFLEKLADLRTSAPTTSLAHLRAKWMAGALHALLMHPRDATLRKKACEMRDAYRKQSEAGK